MVSSILSVLAFAAAVSALKVTSPTSSDVWTVGDSQTVTWETVSSDQDTFNIYLSNMASYPSTTILLASDVSSSAGSADIDGSKLTSGDSFTINFTNGTETEQIYAQSNQFNITEGSSSSSSSSSSASSTAASSTSSGSSTATATDSSSTASSTATSASGSSSGSSSSSSTATGSGSSASSTSSSGAGKIVAGWMGVIAVAVMAL
ncbi:hypothetical protein N0V93_001955 [Gnomoniopsis smithogilvyi]|uniref:Yeast cell wall synthesis Kre9/Knh1-like N-terminal domain-containing protein n=1 Tax=Gnomoniopsis smithogilvyi TaxID=1191159 RepID=A0A9W8Z4U5_9PEZI|nr:hypothetical protein N0V93_001955 [Gnomoniopsis smithogilvyi]